MSSKLNQDDYDPPRFRQGWKTLAESAGVFVAVDQGLKWWRYSRAVGAQNASLGGFQVWKSQMRLLIRAQPRISVKRGLLGLAGVLVFWLLAVIPHNPLPWLFGLLAVASLVYALAHFAHGPPPDGWVKLINAGCPQWSSDMDSEVANLITAEPPWVEMLNRASALGFRYDNWVRLAEQMADGRGRYRQPTNGRASGQQTPSGAGQQSGQYRWSRQQAGQQRASSGQQPFISESQSANLALLGLTRMPTDARGLVHAMHQQARITHPEHGGSTAAFTAMMQAYERLLAFYPKTGKNRATSAEEARKMNRQAGM
jgi:hypothetical protein